MYQCPIIELQFITFRKCAKIHIFVTNPYITYYDSNDDDEHG